MRDMKPEQRRQCRRFLAELRRTGNVRLSAKQAGVSPATLHGRRRAYPAFATEWAAALGFARATLAEQGSASAAGAKAPRGEYLVAKGFGGELQVKRANPRYLSAEGEQLFLQTLAATCNIRLACRAAGIAPSNIYARRRRSDLFADRMDAALAQGHERLEFALMESALCSLAPEEMAGHWAELGVEPPSPLAVMSFDQVINAMGMHMKRVVLGQKRRAHNEHVTTSEETDAAITKLLGMFKKRKAALEKVDWETGERPAAPVETVAAAEGDAVLPQEALPDAAGATARVRVLE